VKAVLKGVDVIVSMRGKNVTRLNLKKNPPTEAELHAAILGPFGNLRAPALRKGKTLIVGFNEETYRTLFP
jgi:arsenate reductase-like glutaredoxin family protein